MTGRENESILEIFSSKNESHTAACKLYILQVPELFEFDLIFTGL